MKIFVGLVAADTHLRQHFGSSKDAVIPKEALNRGAFSRRGASAFLSAYVPNSAPDPRELQEFVLSRAKDADACLLLVDSDLIQLVSQIRNSVFVVTFDAASAGSSLRNFFHKLTAHALKAFGQILSRFQKSEDGNLLTLPLRNFRADELAEIARLCREENTEPAFGDLVERQLVLLRRRLRPRRRSSYKTVYAVDDLKRFFVYGKERHSKFATGGEHYPYCEIAGRLRFGSKIDADRHFNVSETEGDTTSISGAFRDCHNVMRHVQGNRQTSHLNMFANDYF